MRQLRSILAVLSIAVVLLTILSPSARAQEGADTGELAGRLAKADQLLAQEKFSAAAEEFRRANELADGKSAGALLGLAIAEYKDKAYENAAAAARRLLELTNAPDQRMAAYNLLGLSLVDSKRVGPKRLKQAEEAFRKVLELSQGQAKMAHFNLASVLRERDSASEALVEAREYLRAEPSPDMSDRTRILICDLRRSLPGGAPPPRKTTADPPAENSLEQLESGSGAEEASTRHIGGDVQKPEKIFAPQPDYNLKARKKGIEGVVIVQAIIDREGCVVNTKVLKGLPKGLSDQAVEALRRWVFRPAELLGEPVDVYYNLTVNFRLQRKKRS